MKLSECTYGKIITCIMNNKAIIGMVVGLTDNGFGEAIPLVQLQSDLDPIGLHHSHLYLYEG